MTLNDLKREHNRLLQLTQTMYEHFLEVGDEISRIRKHIEEAEGEDFDPIPLIFGAGLHICPDDDDVQVDYVPMCEYATASAFEYVPDSEDD